jgi:hypothetical protein
MSWICVFWLGVVWRTYAVMSAPPDKGMAKLFKPLATLISVTYSPTFGLTSVETDIVRRVAGQ